MPIAQPMQKAFDNLPEMILPHRCLGGAAMINGEASLCAECWQQLTLIGPPSCRCCGYPLSQMVADEPLFGGCAVTPPLDDRARAALRYDDGSRGMILRSKHADRTDIARIFRRLMAHAGRDLFEEVDLIVPFPLHRWRLVQRGYNQAAMSAE